MKTYILRALHYGLKMLVVLIFVFAILILTNTAKFSNSELINHVFLSQKGMILFGALIVLMLIYPLIGFIRHEMWAISIPGSRGVIIKALDSCGYTLTFENENRLEFTMSNAIKRFISVTFEKVVITTSADGQGIVIEGLRKEVSKVELRIRALTTKNE